MRFERLPRPKAIFFDVDDTLVKYVGFSDKLWHDMLEEEVLSKYPQISRDALEKMISGALPRTFPKEFGVDPVEFWKEVDKAILRKRRELWKEGKIVPYPDSKVIFEIEIPIVAISNASEEATKYSLEVTGLMGAFEMIIGKIYENVNWCKPNPGQIKYACSKLRISPEEVWFVGNSRIDMLASCRAGSFPIQVMRGEGILKEALAVIPDLYKLLDLLEVALS